MKTMNLIGKLKAQLRVVCIRSVGLARKRWSRYLMTRRHCPLCRSRVRVSSFVETHRDKSQWRYFQANCCKCKWEGIFIDYKERVTAQPNVEVRHSAGKTECDQKQKDL